jgi:hypothetical protein
MTNSTETILGMIGSATYAEEYYSLFFTTAGIIRARTVSAVKNLFTVGTWSQTMSMKKARKLAAMTPDAIIQDDKSNFYIPYTDIKLIIMKKGKLPIFFTNTYIVLVTDKEKYFFSLPRQIFDECARTVNMAIPDKLAIE